MTYVTSVQKMVHSFYLEILIRDSRDEPCFTKKTSSSCQIKMNTLFRNIYGIKIRKYNMNIHKAMRISDSIFQANKTLFLTIYPKNGCKLEFTYCLWLLFLDQPMSDFVVFAND